MRDDQHGEHPSAARREATEEVARAEDERSGEGQSDAHPQRAIVRISADRGVVAVRGHPAVGPCSPPQWQAVPSRLWTLPLVIAALLVSGSRAAAVTTLWPTYHLDPGRSGNDTGEPAFNSLSGTWNTPALDGAIYAEPLVDGNNVIVATENDSLYAFDASSGTLHWGPVHLGTPRTSNFLCGNINPLGITGTPVIDGGYLYALAEIQTSTSTFEYHLAKVDPSSGAVSYNLNITPAGMDASVQQERSALAVSSGNVVIAWGGLNGDCGTYHGYIETVSESSGVEQHQWNDTSGGSEGGMWAASGPAVDAAGNIYVATGNGSSSNINNYDYGDSVLKFSPSLALQSFFAPGSPQTWASLNASDTDLGSLDPSLLSGGLLFEIGKGGRGYLLNQSGLPSNSNPGGGENYSAQVCNATSDAAFSGLAVSGSVVFVPCADGIAAVNIDPLPSTGSGIRPPAADRRRSSQGDLSGRSPCSEAARSTDWRQAPDRSCGLSRCRQRPITSRLPPRVTAGCSSAPVIVSSPPTATLREQMRRASCTPTRCTRSRSTRRFTRFCTSGTRVGGTSRRWMEPARVLDWGRPPTTSAPTTAHSSTTGSCRTSMPTRAVRCAMRGGMARDGTSRRWTGLAVEAARPPTTSAPTTAPWSTMGSCRTSTLTRSAVRCAMRGGMARDGTSRHWTEASAGTTARWSTTGSHRTSIRIPAAPPCGMHGGMARDGSSRRWTGLAVETVRPRTTSAPTTARLSTAGSCRTSTPTRPALRCVMRGGMARDGSSRRWTGLAAEVVRPRTASAGTTAHWPTTGNHRTSIGIPAPPPCAMRGGVAVRGASRRSTEPARVAGMDRSPTLSGASTARSPTARSCMTSTTTSHIPSCGMRGGRARSGASKRFRRVRYSASSGRRVCASPYRTTTSPSRSSSCRPGLAIRRALPGAGRAAPPGRCRRTPRCAGAVQARPCVCRW
ncbi:MAG: hypothetical protein E6I33_06700 [Chloroflexi bacterium]|nr:MAG: hypothetical protein E6I33_06700 [Chloroflexota bacterium]